MIHPVGELPAAIYWRRRALIVVAVVLAVVTAFTLFSGGGGKKSNGAAAESTSSSRNTAAATTVVTTQPPTSPTTAQTTATTSIAPQTNTVVAPKPCVATNLSIAAATDAISYKVGATPMLALVVTNTGPAPCIQDLADPQIELRVYSGSARVWGSHDCAVQPGTSPQTLPVGKPIQRAIQWSGLSSEPNCAGTRTRVGAGVYQVIPLLSGQQGVAAKFSFTA